MKIALVTQPWDEVIPTVETSSIPIIAYQLARRLAKSCDVIIYAKRGNAQPKVEWDDDRRVQIRRVAVNVEWQLLKPAKLVFRLAGTRLAKRPVYARSWYHLGYFLQVANDLRKQQCDIVHIFNFSQLVPLVRALNQDVKIVLHMECEWLTQLDRALIEPRLEKADLIIGCSRFVTEKICERFPHMSDKCQTLHNAVNPEKFSCDAVSDKPSNKDVKRLLFVGRLSPEKGLHVLLEAFQIVAKSHPSVQMDIVGGSSVAPVEFTIWVTDDDKTAELSSFYANATRSDRGNYFSFLKQQLPPNLADKMFFRGGVKQSNMVDYYCRADIFVFPSVWNEPFGIPLIEAMACRVPVVATHSGGMTEIVENGKTGLLVERGDAKALADALITLISNNELRESMGEAGRQRVVEFFSWDGIAEELLHQYEQLVGDES